MAASANDSLLTSLSAITGTGGFHSAGSTPFFFPLLHVEKLGELAFPLSASQAKELVALSEAARYGLGEKTVRDENDRKVPLGSYRIEEDVLLTHAPFGEGEPDENEAEGYTAEKDRRWPPMHFRGTSATSSMR